MNDTPKLFADGMNRPARLTEEPWLGELLDAVPAQEFFCKIVYVRKRRPKKLIARCPVHMEGNPSFELQNIHRPGRFQCVLCRGCGFSGDIIDLLAAIEGVPRHVVLHRMQEDYLPASLNTASERAP